MQLLYAKNASKNYLVFEKLDHFENCQKWPPCRGYRLCKILTLGQKIKIHKKMLKTFLQHIAVVLCKKRLQKTANIRKWEHFKNCLRWPPTKGYRPCKIVTLGHQLKMHESILERFLQYIAVVLCKKRLEKPHSIRKIRSFWK